MDHVGAGMERAEVVQGLKRWDHNTDFSEFLLVNVFNDVQWLFCAVSSFLQALYHRYSCIHVEVTIAQACLPKAGDTRESSEASNADRLAIPLLGQGSQIRPCILGRSPNQPDSKATAATGFGQENGVIRNGCSTSQVAMKDSGKKDVYIDCLTLIQLPIEQNDIAVCPKHQR